MSRIAVLVLCVFLPLAALVAVAMPAPVRAAYIKLAYDASLQETPQDAAVSLAMLPGGVVVTITGDPVDGYYPVTAGGKSGWVRGDALALDPVNTVPAEPVAATPAPDAVVEDELVAVDPGPIEPAAEDVAPDASLAGGTPVAEPLLQDPVPADLASAEPAPAEPVTQDPAVTAPVVEAAPPATSPLDPNAPPVTVPDPGPVGPAAVAVEAEIFAGPGPEYGVLGMASAGALVEQTGHAVGGYVTVRYVGVTGWIPLDHLGPAPTTASS